MRGDSIHAGGDSVAFREEPISEDCPADLPERGWERTPGA